jgi:hypothetical protein
MRNNASLQRARKTGANVSRFWKQIDWTLWQRDYSIARATAIFASNSV